MKQQLVHTTTNYDQFKSIGGNRTKNLLHINRLIKSMKENYIFTIIVVNEKNQIIDGQHRFDAIKELGLPLHYVVCKGYGLKEVHVLNANSKQWDANDYMAAYSQLGYSDYIEYARFKEKYQLPHSICIPMLYGFDSGSVTKTFYGGEFKIANLKKSIDKAEKLMMLGKYYSGFKRRSFAMVICSLLDNKNFDFKHFLGKLAIQPTALKDCANNEQYRLLIEDIYNYRSRDKVSLRY